PSQSSYDIGETRLGDWLTAQRVNAADRVQFGRSHSAPEVASSGDSPRGGSYQDVEHTFRQRVGQVAEFVKPNDRWPIGGSPDANENYLAAMLSGWRSAATGRNGRHSSKFKRSRLNYLNRMVDGTRSSGEGAQAGVGGGCVPELAPFA